MCNYKVARDTLNALFVTRVERIFVTNEGNTPVQLISLIYETLTSGINFYMLYQY